MCNFLSAIVMKSGDVLMHPMLDSHSDLIQYFGLNDTGSPMAREAFAKVELTPADETWLEPTKWTWRVDEETRPDWMDAVEDRAKARLIEIASKMIITGEKRLIIDGCWIIAGNAKIYDVRGGRIVCVWGGSFSGVVGGSFTDVRGGSFSGVVGGSFTGVGGGSFSGVVGGSFSGVGGGSFSSVGGDAKFSSVWGGSFTDVWGDAKFSSVGPTVILDASAKTAVERCKAAAPANGGTKDA